MPFIRNDSNDYLFIFYSVNHPGILVYPPAPKAGQTPFKLFNLCRAGGWVRPLPIVREASPLSFWELSFDLILPIHINTFLAFCCRIILKMNVKFAETYNCN